MAPTPMVVATTLGDLSEYSFVSLLMIWFCRYPDSLSSQPCLAISIASLGFVSQTPATTGKPSSFCKKTSSSELRVPPPPFGAVAPATISTITIKMTRRIAPSTPTAAWPQRGSAAQKLREPAPARGEPSARVPITGVGRWLTPVARFATAFSTSRRGNVEMP